VPNLTSVAVQRLLGQFDHSFNFPEDSEFVILHGPNGIGKTKLLELINATLGGNPLKAATIPFEEAVFSFDDGTVLRTFKETVANQKPDIDEEIGSNPRLIFELIRPDEDVQVWTVPALDSAHIRRLISTIDREFPVSRITPDTWRDMYTGELINSFDLIARYGSLLPKDRINVLWKEDNPVVKFVRSLNVYFIETQRLLVQRRLQSERYAVERVTSTRSRVQDLAEDLTRRLSEALAENSRTSQQLDRDFPRRIMVDQHELPEATDEAIQERYNEQSALRQRLAEISLLDSRPDLPLPKRTLEEWERRVLWTYLTDSEKKLKTFIPILERATLLTDIVNSRFLFKDLAIDRNRGFRFVTESGTDISAELLSSGEQHELVLAYELLFQAQRGSLVLIDEPEISLHVAWQKAFLNDIVRIAQVSSLRFIVATHSPQIINKWWSRAIALHPEGDELDEGDL
jgi:energy-coupling factor transporter ATP-binding protein EcfA2